MAKKSAGILMYRHRSGATEVFLVHPGGPFWVKKDVGAWSIPKGEYGRGENPFEVAKREFQEETGIQVSGEFIPLKAQTQSGGKVVSAWALEGDCDPSSIVSNTLVIEWPPRSGRMTEFPEVDRAGWFPIPEAREKILKGQVGFLDELDQILTARR